MTTRRIIRTDKPKNHEKNVEKAEKYANALMQVESFNKQLVLMNQQLKDKTNAMVEEIERCLQNLFARVELIEHHMGLAPSPRETIDVQTIAALAEEKATDTNTTETSNTNEQPSLEDHLAQ